MRAGATVAGRANAVITTTIERISATVRPAGSFASLASAPARVRRCIVSQIINARSATKNAIANHTNVSPSSAWRWMSSDSLSSASWNSSPLLAASCDATTATPASTTTTQPIRCRQDAETTITMAPTAHKGINATGIWTSSGCAGSPNRFPTSMTRLLFLGQRFDARPPERRA